jgi:hypothetical protein
MKHDVSGSTFNVQHPSLPTILNVGVIQLRNTTNSRKKQVSTENKHLLTTVVTKGYDELQIMVEIQHLKIYQEAAIIGLPIQKKNGYNPATFDPDLQRNDSEAQMTDQGRSGISLWQSRRSSDITEKALTTMDR